MRMQDGIVEKMPIVGISVRGYVKIFIHVFILFFLKQDKGRKVWIKMANKVISKAGFIRKIFSILFLMENTEGVFGFKKNTLTL